MSRTSNIPPWLLAAEDQFLAPLNAQIRRMDAEWERLNAMTNAHWSNQEIGIGIKRCPGNVRRNGDFTARQ